MTRYTNTRSRNYRPGGKRMGYTKRKTETIGGHELYVMPSKMDGKPCNACRETIDQGANISPYAPDEQEPWMYGSKVWLHSKCVALCLDGSHPVQQTEEVTSEDATETRSKVDTSAATAEVAGSPQPNITGRDAALIVMDIKGIGKAMIPSWWSHVTLAPEQAEALVRIVTTEHNAQIIAGPGCGKSFFIQFLSWVVKATGVYVVFNNSMKREQEEAGKLYRNVSIGTNHSSGLAIVKDNVRGNVTIAGSKHDRKGNDANVKVRTILWDLIPVDRYAAKDVKAKVRAKRQLAQELVSHYKSQLKAHASDGRYLMDRFNVATRGLTDSEVTEVLNIIPSVLAECEAQGRAGYIDFDDMIWLPIVCGWTPRQRSWVFIDEAQDLSPAQLKLALMIAGSEGRTIMVGDPLQAIYAWRGAALNGMDDAYQTLKAHPKGCIRLYLMGTFRTPRSGVALCNALYPQANIPLTTHVDRDGYIVRVESDSDWLETLIASDKVNNTIIECRTNAPLVRGALQCIKNGRKAVIQGRDLSSDLIELIKRVNEHGNEDVGNMLAALELYLALETRKAEAKGTTVSQSLSDKVACIYALAEGCEKIGKASQPETLRGRMAAIFNDDTQDAIVFSTIHQIKGLEAPYIVVLEPSLMPGPWAETEDQREEERHIQWVAYSRHQHAIIFVGGSPSCGLPNGYQWSTLNDAIANDPFTSNGKGESEAPQAKVENEPQEDSGKPETVTVPGMGPVTSLPTVKAPKVSTFRLSTTLDTRGGMARDVGKNGVDCCKVTDKDGRNIGGTKRTNRTPGWRDRIIGKLNELSGLNVPTFGDKRAKGAVDVTREDWDAIAEAINAQDNATAYYHVPKGWKMTALIVEVTS